MKLERAEASVNLIFAYGNADNLTEARALFEAMKELGDSEEVKLERAKASFNLIVDYGKAGNLTEARSLFDSEEVKPLLKLLYRQASGKTP